MPRYYIMDKDDTMRQSVAKDMSNENSDVVAARSDRWLSDAELSIYVSEYTRTSFQGGLNWYRIQTSPSVSADMQVWSGAKISVPTVFIAGSRDWGTWQEPGAVEAMEHGKSVREGMYRGTVLVEGAGHWVQQERPQECVEEILKVIGGGGGGDAGLVSGKL
jgi:pimeloyl-ACP methyl ester carboxylesterase